MKYYPFLSGVDSPIKNILKLILRILTFNGDFSLIKI